MTERAEINRPITAAEVAVIRAALERAATVPGYLALAEGLSALCVIDQCPCGCDSVDFAEHDPENPAEPIADAIGETPAGGMVGVIVWGLPARVTGLEIYDLGAGKDAVRLPTPDSIQPFFKGAD
jgi:hypothetical protein